MKIKRIAASECRAALTRVMDKILQDGARYIITKNNHPKVIILSMKDYRHLKEEIKKNDL